MRAFIFTHNPILQSEYVYDILNKTTSVETWVAPFSYSAILISKLTVSELSAVLHSHFGDAWFILVEANKDNVNGWLPNDFWEYILDPYTVWARQFQKSSIPNLSQLQTK